MENKDKVIAYIRINNSVRERQIRKNYYKAVMEKELGLFLQEYRKTLFSKNVNFVKGVFGNE
ncbi:hypothetical protein GCM10011409_44340 [Lentibacillus populi]|uniref:Resolvase/invertase-type recombinase catalytic domain-containing protein n=1 Tax=Lentibacillus populi TaxID=1827502 RepID=A0A9W5U308_9BACI|nr:hypothetical protein [Lentibacillus populi]GGB62283.1 hypothetical protein GCM10011409_44340 [Lentibacillus populi]